MFIQRNLNNVNPRVNTTEKGRMAFSLTFFLLLFSSPLSAQLCQGSLGDPIVDIDFGSGSSVHAGALPSGQTSYTYSYADFPMDGSYTVENSTAGSGSTWWSTTDHTGNSGGYMMVVNASISLTDYFYRKTVTGLCPGTVYEFASWVMNLLRSSDLSPPNITFSIETTDGTVIKSYTTGSIPLTSSPVWKQYGFYFSTPAGVSTVVIVMRNNSAGGRPANDIALDDITFRPCGPTVTAVIAGSTAVRDTVCQGSALTVHLQGSVSTGYTNPDYQWQKLVNGAWQDIPGADFLEYVFLVSDFSQGEYSFRLAASEGGNFSYLQCRVESNDVILTVIPAPMAKYGIVTGDVCVNQPVVFTDSSQTTGAVTYLWNFGDGGTSSVKDPTHIYSQSGTYTTSLIISTSLGCSDTLERTIIVILRPVPVAKFTVYPTDTTIFYATIAFTDESSGASSCSINWGDGTVTDCSTTTHKYPDPGVYDVTEIVANGAGCTDTAHRTVTIRAVFKFYIPNAFTPDGDGLNDVFRPVLSSAEDYTFLVFNRFGQLLFETHDIHAGWDGQYKGELCPTESYIYKISLLDEEENRYRVYTGSFILLRK
jgi:gliding motility-associated-like protein